jgi:large subunit ribosomal protein L5
MATAAKAKPASKPYQARLKTLYNDELVKKLQKDLKLSNVHEVPRLEKIVVNVGLGKAKDEKRLMEVATNTITKITGQQPVQTTARM